MKPGTVKVTVDSSELDAAVEKAAKLGDQLAMLRDEFGVATVRVMQIRPGDKVLLKVPDMADDHIVALRDHAKTVWPDNEVLVLGAGIDAEIVRPEASE